MGKKKKLKEFRTKENMFKTRKEYLLSCFDSSLLYSWFEGDEKKLDEFGNKLLVNDTFLQEEDTDILKDNSESSSTVYDNKISKIIDNAGSEIFDLKYAMFKIKEVNKKRKKDAKRSMKISTSTDMGIYSYLSCGRYSKKFLSKNKYRKELKRLAKNEKQDMEDMKKLGFIRSKNVDEELKKIKEADALMGHALSDSYTQKYFL